MGGIINSIFGGGSNKATKQGIAALQPYSQAGAQDLNAYNAMLTSSDPAAWNNWLNSSDYQFTTKSGTDAINQDMAARGLLNSGATLKAVTQFGQNNAQQYRNNYMNQLLAPASIGANAAAGVASTAQAGATQQANGVGNALNFGLGIAGLFSDERLKTDIKKVGRTNKKSGDLPVYTYRYKDDPTNVVRMGVMAQEVAKKRPDALGPRVANFMTVNYGKLANA